MVAVNRRHVLQGLLAVPAAVAAGFSRPGFVTLQAAPTPPVPPQRPASLAMFDELTTTAARCAEEMQQAFEGMQDNMVHTSAAMRKLERALRTMRLHDMPEYMLHCSPEALWELRKAWPPPTWLDPEPQPGLGYAFTLTTPWCAPMKVTLSRYLPKGGWVLCPVDWHSDWYTDPDYAPVGIPQQVVSYDGQFMRARWQPEVIDRLQHQDGSLELTLRRGPCEQRALLKAGWNGRGSGGADHVYLYRHGELAPQQTS